MPGLVRLSITAIVVVRSPEVAEAAPDSVMRADHLAFYGRWEDVAAEWERLGEALNGRRAANRAAKTQPRRTDIADETCEELRALGYIEP